MLRKEDRNSVKKKELRGRLDNYSNKKLLRIQEYTGQNDSQVLRDALDCYYREMILLGEIQPLNQDEINSDIMIKAVKKVGTIISSYSNG